ncbi:MAG TPA: tripartite tricarboxylate transporter TctB family protein [Burkholderiales bacterium]|nr:tripartite tricarboxylate transporter TctB family protein [Burkholderiales bacterium]
MGKADRVTAVLLLAFSVAFAAGALKYYAWWGDSGPGPAFMPFWLGLVMAAIALLLLLRKPRDTGKDWVPRGEGARRVLVVLGVTVAFVVLMQVVGMIVGGALFLAVLMRYLERQPWWQTIVISVTAAAFNWLVFAHWLRVPIPQGIFWTF